MFGVCLFPAAADITTASWKFRPPCVLAGPVSCPVQHSHIIVTDIRGFLLTKRSLNRAVYKTICSLLDIYSIGGAYLLKHCIDWHIVKI